MIPRARARRAPALVLLAALGLPLFACAGDEPPPRARPAPSGTPGSAIAPSSTGTARGDYDAAIVLASRDPAKGIAALAAFVERWPLSPLLLPAALRLAELRAQQGDVKGGVRALETAVGRQPTAERADAARLELAKLQRRAGDTAAASETLKGVRTQRLRPNEKREAMQLQAELASDQGDAVGRVLRLADLRAATADADARALLDADLDEVIARMEVDELARAAGLLGERAPAARLRLREAELALKSSDATRALEALAEASRLPLSREEAPRLAELEERAHALEAGEAIGTTLPVPPEAPTAPLPETAGARGTLGVVLPLSGKLAAFGERSLAGILVASGFPEGTGSGGGVRLLVRDTGGSPQAAAAALHELASDPEVTAVIGPLTAEEADAAAAVADADGIPLLTLSARESVTQGRTNVFRLGVSPRGEAEALAEYATHSLGLRRFAVLAPDDAFGRGLSELFQSGVLARGGTIAGTATYPRKTSDFGPVFKTLVGGALPTAEAPGAPFEAIFVADSRDRATLIASQLSFHNLSGARLLGPRGWLHPDFLRQGGRHVEGAIVAEPFDPEYASPLVEEFVRRCRQRFGETPDVVTAQAFDAAVLAMAELVRGASGDRGALRDGLSRVRDVPGVAGATTVREDHNADKRSTLAAVENGRFIRLGIR
jgi:ABC-type branched-subunit amino acid transport system substrate-binding protein